MFLPADEHLIGRKLASLGRRTEREGMEHRSSVKSPDSVFMGSLKADARTGLIVATSRTDSRHATLSGDDHMFESC